MDHYSGLKRSEAVKHTAMWMNLEEIHNEGTQTQKDACCRIQFIGNVQKRQIHGNRK